MTGIILCYHIYIYIYNMYYRRGHCPTGPGSKSVEVRLPRRERSLTRFIPSGPSSFCGKLICSVAVG